MNSGIIDQNLKFDITLKVLLSLNNRYLVVSNKENILKGTITEGDIRRFLFKKKFRDISKFTAKDVMNKKPFYVLDNPSKKKIIETLKLKNHIKFYPLITKEKKILKIFQNKIKKKRLINNNVVIMAGGLGKRLRPLTIKIPKPLIELNQIPNIDRIIRQLLSQGIHNLIICLKYKANHIKKFIKKQKYNANIKFIIDKKFLGTAGPLANVNFNNNLPFFLLNSDLVFDLDFKEMINFHNKQKSHMTVCVKNKKYQIPFGVIKTNGKKIIEINEKPSHDFYLNSGIYLIKQENLNNLTKNRFYTIVDLINLLIKKNKNVTPFELYDDWFDIGTLNDLEKAQEYLRTIEKKN